MQKLHAHTDGEAVEGIHQTDGKGLIADFHRTKLFCQRQENVIRRVGLGDMGYGFGPGQRRLLSRQLRVEVENDDQESDRRAKEAGLSVQAVEKLVRARA